MKDSGFSGSLTYQHERAFRRKPSVPTIGTATQQENPEKMAALVWGAASVFGLQLLPNNTSNSILDLWRLALDIFLPCQPEFLTTFIMLIVELPTYLDLALSRLMR